MSTAERLLSFFQEKWDLWLEQWTREFEQIILPTGSEGNRAKDLSWPVPIYHQAKSVAPVAQKRRDLVHEVMEEGMGVLADKPCSNCARRKKTCWLHADDKLGKCLDCTRGVVGEMKTRECSRSSGVGDEEFALRPYHPFSEASRGRRASAGSTRSHQSPSPDSTEERRPTVAQR